jgi:acyl-CoA synthetase (AMP-forming)/AMP-acid ligase II
MLKERLALSQQAGILRAGCIAFLISPRNALDGVVHLLAVSNTCLVFGSSDYTEKVLLDGVRAKIGDKIKIVESPLFNDIFKIDGTDERELLPPMSTPEDNNGTALIIHSSGSTAL